MGLHADVGIKNHLGKPRGFGLLQCVDDAMRAAEKYRVLGERGGLNLLEPLCHFDEISVARRHVLGIPGQRRDYAIPVATYLARAGGVLLGPVVTEMDEVAAHQAAALPASFAQVSPSKPSSAILTRQAGKRYIVFHVEVDVVERAGPDSVGIDFGLTSLIALSNGETEERPNWTKHAVTAVLTSIGTLLRLWSYTFVPSVSGPVRPLSR